MTPVNRFSMIAIALAALGTSISAASAETLVAGQSSAPRRGE